MNKSGRRLVFAAVVVVLLIVLAVVNVFFYPFTSAKPNFADVERVFNKIVVPADWIEIDSSENRGIAGRACPIEPGSACFRKSVTYSIPNNTETSIVQSKLAETGCPSPSIKQTDFGDGNKNSFELLCSVDGLEVAANIRYTGDKAELYISVRT